MSSSSSLQADSKTAAECDLMVPSANFWMWQEGLCPHSWSRSSPHACSIKILPNVNSVDKNFHLNFNVIILLHNFVCLDEKGRFTLANDWFFRYEKHIGGALEFFKGNSSLTHVSAWWISLYVWNKFLHSAFKYEVSSRSHTAPSVSVKDASYFLRFVSSVDRR